MTALVIDLKLERDLPQVFPGSLLLIIIITHVSFRLQVKF